MCSSVCSRFPCACSGKFWRSASTLPGQANAAIYWRHGRHRRRYTSKFRQRGVPQGAEIMGVETAEHRHVACAVRAVSVGLRAFPVVKLIARNGNRPQDNGSLLCVAVAVGRTGHSRFESTSALLLSKPHITGGIAVSRRWRTTLNKEMADAISGQVAHLKVLRSRVSAS